MEKYIQAGKIAREARELGASRVRAGGSSLELADEVEGLIRKRGGKCAFPVNIGVNDVAAHYSPSKHDDIKFRPGDIVKLDVGAHVDGYPADTTTTVEVDTRNHAKLIESANEALRASVEMVAPGTPVSALGSAIARVIKSAGFRPIENLVGHTMERYNLHAGLSIPNIETKDHSPLKEGMILAIEPFSTNGSGKVNARGRGNIYRIIRERKAPADVEALFHQLKLHFGPFPFAARWCEPLDGNALSLVTKMTRLGMLMNYPVLAEVAHGFVAQAEHSVIVTAHGCRVLT